MPRHSLLHIISITFLHGAQVLMRVLANAQLVFGTEALILCLVICRIAKLIIVIGHVSANLLTGYMLLRLALHLRFYIV